MTKDEYLEKIGRRIRYYREACGMMIIPGDQPMR